MALGGPTVTGLPYSATETLTVQEKFADGNSVNTTTTVQRARDTQGRTYSSETITPPASSGKAAYQSIHISDPVAGYSYQLNSSTMIAVQTRIPGPPPGGGHSGPTGATGPTLGTVTLSNGATVTTSSLGTAQVNGVSATGTQITQVIPAGAIGNAQPITTTRTTWVSVDLKMPVEIKTTDPRTGTSDMELKNISLGAPSASLFTVPAGYTIQSGGSGGRGPGGPSGARGGSGGGAFARPGGFGRPGGGPGGPAPFGRRGGPPPQQQ